MVADYNRMVTVRSHRIDTNRRNMAYNLLLSWKLKQRLFLYLCPTLVFGEGGIGLGLGVLVFEAQSTSGIPSGCSCPLWCVQAQSVRTDLFSAMAESNLRKPSWKHYESHWVDHYITWPFPPGITLDILALDFWVPGSCARADAPQYKGKEVFREILEVTEAVSILYVERVTQDSIFSIHGKNTKPMMFCVSSQVGFPRCQLIIS